MNCTPASGIGGSSCKTATPSPADRELHACDLLAGRGKLARIDGKDCRLSPEHGAEIFMDGLRVVEDAAGTIGGVEIVNVCLHKPDVIGHERASLDRLLNRINTSVAGDDRHAFLIFDEGREEMVGPPLSKAQEPQPHPQQVREVGGRRADEGHPDREGHRWPHLPKLPLRPHATDGRPDRPRPPQAGGGAVHQGEATGHSTGLLHPRSRPQPQGVQAGPPGRRQAVRVTRTGVFSSRQESLPSPLAPVSGSPG